jgi:leucyl aminopeptidase|tara:strand:- start:619 stop:972 length:354 start_codon:yes stop_codon:yes gene_type:complete
MSSPASGPEVAGVFTPDDGMASEIDAAARDAGEAFWRMPMRESYWEQMKSEIADMKNTGTRGGGSITAALFLRRFVENDDAKWAHLDIAGPVWDDKKGGATGFGAATLASWISNAAK